MSEEPAQSSSKKTLLGHPIGLYVLFFTEMWERFSFYGMRFILVLFLRDELRGGFGWPEAAALTTAGLYSMFGYLFSIPGGILGDSYLGKKRSVLIGGILQCIGHFLLAFKSVVTFFLGLIVLIIGTGLLKSNISSLVSNLYAKGDPKKDKGFSIFYMGVNLGSMLAGFTVTTLAESWGWHWGFTIAGFGMLIGITTYLLFQGYVPQAKEEKLVPGGLKKVSLVSLGSSLAIAALCLGIYYAGYMAALAGWIQSYKQLISNLIASLIALVIIGYIVQNVISAKTKVERERMLAFSVALLLIFIFFTGFEQAGGLMTLYTSKYTNTSIGGWIVPASAVQNLNPIFVVLFSVLVSTILLYFKARYKNFNSTFQMALGNVIMGLGFLFMIGACLQREHAVAHGYVENIANAKSSMLWLVGAYFFHTMGELCSSPVVLSFATNMAPKGKEAFTMGTVFAFFGLSGHFAAQLGSLSESYGEKTIFQIAAIIPIVLGLLFMLVNRKVVTWTHGAEEKEQGK